MSVSYDVFIGSFLEKVTERDLLSLEQSQRDSVVIGYMKQYQQFQLNHHLERPR